MSLDDIKLQIEKIEKLIFLNSICKSLPLKELADAYRNLIILRNQFLSSSFSEMTLGELDELRYRIIENILNVRIEIKDRVGLNCEREKEDLKRLLLK